MKLPGKVGTKKLRRIQEKAERKAKREVREEGREKGLFKVCLMVVTQAALSYHIPFPTPAHLHPHTLTCASKRRHYEKIRSAEKH